ncbi:MAG TPA: NAD-dependent epimerase/dehydratase family protein, partial [Thermoleophilaceae bacterium]
MRVVVLGGSGNVGTSVLRALGNDPDVASIVAISRRAAQGSRRIEWRERDVTRDDIRPDLDGADALIALSWAIQPSRDRERLRAVNVDGNRTIFNAAAAAGVPSLLYASSVGAYSPGPKDRAVDESWRTDGIASSFYSHDKADVERVLDQLETDHPEMRVVRIRPGLVFKREAGSEIRRY